MFLGVLDENGMYLSIPTEKSHTSREARAIEPVF